MQHLAPSESTEIDEDLISMLSAMALSLDRFCPYHEHTCHSAPSPKVCAHLPRPAQPCCKFFEGLFCVGKIIASLGRNKERQSSQLTC